MSTSIYPAFRTCLANEISPIYIREPIRNYESRRTNIETTPIPYEAVTAEGQSSSPSRAIRFVPFCVKLY